jgi:SAM-dependent methyltransferase
VGGARGRWFVPDHAGWDPRTFEGYFGTPLGATIRRREEAAVYEFLGAALEPDHLVLEVGCGTGNYTVPVARRCAGVVALDSSPEMLGYLRERLEREGLENVQARPGRLPGSLESLDGFDGALVVGVLNYARDLGESLLSLAAALKPGGWAVFNVPLTTPEGRVYALAELANRRRAYLRSPAEISSLAEGAGMSVETTTPAGLTRGGLTLVVGARATERR